MHTRLDCGSSGLNRAVREGGVMHRMAWAIIAAIVIATAPSARSEPASEAAASREVAAHVADARLAAYTADQPGLQVIVARGGRTLYERNLGAADLERQTPITAQTRFHVASVSKQFTAFAALLLASEGKLDLDADVHTYLPQLADYGAPLTVADLIHHTSGLRDQWDLETLSGTSMEGLIRQKALIAMAASQKGLNFRPGDDFRYSNTGYALLAEIVAQRSGRPFRAYVADRIFKPIGMTHTLVYDDADEILPDRAMSYRRRPDGQLRLARLNYANYGATSTHTTARDLVLWSRELLHPRVFSADLVRRAIQPGRLRDGRPLTYAFGMVRDTIAGHQAIFHTGSDAGYRALVASFPEEDATVVVLSNGAADVSQIAEDLTRIFLGERGPAPSAVVSPDPAWSARITGHYLGPWGSGFELKLVDGKLILATGAGPGVAVTPLADGSFFVRTRSSHYTPRVDGDLDQTQFGGPPVVYRRLAKAPVAAADLEALQGAYHSDELDVTYQLVALGDHLELRSLRDDPVVLYPADRDHFDGAIGVRVVRDGAGRAAALAFSTSRVRELIFVRN